MIAIACALLSAIGFFFSFGLGDCWPLAWLAAVPVLWLAFGETRAWIVFFAAWLFFGLAPLAARMRSRPMAGYCSTFVSCALLMIFGPYSLFAASVMMARRIARVLGPVAGMFGFALVWTACDFLAAAGYDGAVISPAYTQISAPFLIQGASVFGLWIVTFVLAFVSAGIAMSLRTRKLLPAALALTLFAANAGFGVWRIDSAAATPVTRVGMAANDALLRSMSSKPGMAATDYRRRTPIPASRENLAAPGRDADRVSRRKSRSYIPNGGRRWCRSFGRLRATRMRPSLSALTRQRATG